MGKDPGEADGAAGRKAPYPSDTKAKGWKFVIDLERVRASDTWALAPLEVRPWLYMLWCESWLQTPCGSMPADRAVLAARLGMPQKVLTKHEAILLRGWWKADDGRLYHDTVTECVLEMMRSKEKERERKADFRARKEVERRGLPPDVPRDRHRTDGGRTPDSGGRDDTGTGTGTGYSVPVGTDGLQPSVAKSAEQLTKDELWSVGKSLLSQQGMPARQCGTFVGKLVKEYGDAVVIEVLQSAVVQRPADVAGWLVANCKARGAKRKPVGMTGVEQLAASDAKAERILARRAAGAGSLIQEVIDV